MMKWIFSVMLILGMGFSVFSGKSDVILDSLLEGAGEAVNLSISLGGAYMLWMGLLNIAKDAGLVNGLSRLIRRPLSLLFPTASKSLTPITLNLAANFFGLGSAATPFGLKAMEELKKENHNSDIASDDMCMFIALNSSALEILPTAVISLRNAFLSQNVYAVVVPTFIASVFAFASAIILSLFFRKRRV